MRVLGMRPALARQRVSGAMKTRLARCKSPMVSGSRSREGSVMSGSEGGVRLQVDTVRGKAAAKVTRRTIQFTDGGPSQLPNWQTAPWGRHSVQRLVGLHLVAGGLDVMMYFRPLKVSVFWPVTACLPSCSACSTTLGKPLACSMQNTVMRHAILVAATGIVCATVEFGGTRGIVTASVGSFTAFQLLPVPYSRSEEHTSELQSRQYL